jgi:phosphoribosylamine--glycine ligase
VAVAHGYPGAYRKGDPITIDRAALESTGAKLFFAGASAAASHGGSAQDGNSPAACSPAPGTLISSGGRVLAASAWGVNADEARRRAYRALKAVNFEGMDYRKDIGGNSRSALHPR